MSATLREKVLAAKDAVDHAERIGWLFAASVRVGIDALEQQVYDLTAENLRLRANQRTGRIVHGDA